MTSEHDELYGRIRAIVNGQHDAGHVLIETLLAGAAAVALLDRLPGERMSSLSADLAMEMREHHRIQLAQYEERYGVAYSDERGRMHADEPAFREWALRKNAS